MNLHALAAPFVGIVNPPILGTVKIATGYTTAGDGSRVPTYDETDGVSLQVQALAGREIQHLDSLNITGVLQAVHLSGFLEALDRDAKKGGDLMLFNGQTWLVVHVLERWPSSGWCRVAIQKQLSA